MPSRAIAQTVSPQIVEFDPSADHNAIVSGVAVVEGYELRFHTVGGSQPVHVIDLGKPAPQSDGKIRFNFTALLGAWPVDGVVYEARVAAVGPGGSAVSTISNQFVPGHDASAARLHCRRRLARWPRPRRRAAPALGGQRCSDRLELGQLARSQAAALRRQRTITASPPTRLVCAVSI
jgi:hypothetical protein